MKNLTLTLIFILLTACGSSSEVERSSNTPVQNRPTMSPTPAATSTQIPPETIAEVPTTGSTSPTKEPIAPETNIDNPTAHAGDDTSTTVN